MPEFAAAVVPVVNKIDVAPAPPIRRRPGDLSQDRGGRCPRSSTFSPTRPRPRLPPASPRSSPAPATAPSSRRPPRRFTATRRCGAGPELKAEELRIAARHLGRLTGRIDVEEVLGAIFSEFCIGK